MFVRLMEYSVEVLFQCPEKEAKVKYLLGYEVLYHCKSVYSLRNEFN